MLTYWLPITGSCKIVSASIPKLTVTNSTMTMTTEVTRARMGLLHPKSMTLQAPVPQPAIGPLFPTKLTNPRRTIVHHPSPLLPTELTNPRRTIPHHPSPLPFTRKSTNPLHIPRPHQTRHRVPPLALRSQHPPNERASVSEPSTPRT